MVSIAALCSEWYRVDISVRREVILSDVFLDFPQSLHTSSGIVP
jgi:hypothetical protein